VFNEETLFGHTLHKVFFDRLQHSCLVKLLHNPHLFARKKGPIFLDIGPILHLEKNVGYLKQLLVKVHAVQKGETAVKRKG
jgi:hypothetical protein